REGEPAAEPEAPASMAVPDIELPSAEAAAETEPAAEAIDGLSRGSALADGKADAAADIVSHVDSGLITGFESTHVGPPAAPPKAMEAEPAGGDLPMLDVPELEEEAPAAPVSDAEVTARATSGLTLIMPDLDDAGAPAAEPPARDRAVPPAPEPEPQADFAEDAEPARPAAAKGRRTPAASPATPATPATLADLRGLEEEGASVIDEAFAADIASTVDELRERVHHEPDNAALRRELGEALLENGERSAGLKALEEAMGGFERTGDFSSASSISEELLRVDPNSVRYHQKRVEYAVRANDRPRLVEAYLALAECLFRSGQLDKSRAVYGRVLELAPDDVRAQSAMREAFGTREMAKAVMPPAEPAERPATPAAGNGTTPPPAPADRRRAETPPAGSEPAKRPSAPRRESFVNLSEWLREDDAEKTTRLVAPGGEEPSEQVGFAEMLSMFKQGVSQNVDDEDHESHYDLGVAYKEMGLLDEAIAEFQKALRGTEQRVRTYEALGQCFVEKRQYQIALTILGRALSDKAYTDDMLVGVLYLLGYASESLGQMEQALKYYERVFAVDIQFRDIADRLAAVERKGR
ncbi:MAG TPA: tetratricopeptide repeat protein, partial [Gemmatimonadaceae bacterium]|nr:tetratricopeptide repeat protein [Gemmatimonadaceae bacterium]